MSNLDDQVAEMVLEDSEISPETLKKAIRRLTCELKFVPVLGGSAFKNKGVQPLMDAVVDYLPSPVEVPAATAVEADDETTEVVVEPDDNGNFCSLAFKLWTDPFVGKLVFIRVYSGQLKKGNTIYNPRTRKRDRVSRLIMLQADKRTDVNLSLIHI